MKRIVFVIIVLAVLCAGCSTEEKYSTDCSQYGQWSYNTQQYLNEYFCSSLPSSNAVSKWGRTYFYQSSQAVLSDFNFVIYVELAFSDENEYLNTISDIDCRFSVSAVAKESSYYAIQFSQNDYLEYTDDECLDGMFFNFEGIIANKNEKVIRYITAHVWDYYSHPLLLDEILNELSIVHPDDYNF